VSRALGDIYKDGQIIGYWLYNGSMDVAARPEIVATVEEAWGALYDKYRRGEPWPSCECGGEKTDVMLHSLYGGPPGFYWPGKICMKCRLIVEGREPEETTDGVPEARAA